MLSPSSAARIAAVPSGASSGTTRRVADRLVSRFASTVATTAISSSEAYDVLSGRTSATASPRNPADRAATTTPRQSTKTAKDGCAAWTASRTVRKRRCRAQPTSTTATAPDTQNGSTPKGDSAANPTSITITASSGTRGTAGARGAGAGRTLSARSPRKSHRSTTYSTTRTTASTGAITTAKPPKVRSRCGIASRLVRLLTGSSSDAEFAIRRQA